MCTDGHEGLMMQGSFFAECVCSGRNSGYNVKQRQFPDFRAGRKGSPVRPPFAGHRRGRSLSKKVPDTFNSPLILPVL